MFAPATVVRNSSFIGERAPLATTPADHHADVALKRRWSSDPAELPQCSGCTTAASGLSDCVVCRKLVCVQCSKVRAAESENEPPRRLCTDCFFSLNQADALTLGGIDERNGNLSRRRRGSTGQLYNVKSDVTTSETAAAARDVGSGNRGGDASNGAKRRTSSASGSLHNNAKDMTELWVAMSDDATSRDSSFRRPPKYGSGVEQGLEGVWQWLQRGFECCEAWNGKR